jgi:hypothetical protein
VAKDFIEKAYGSSMLNDAVKQQHDLLYLTESEIQNDITVEYIEQWANRKYATNDSFLNRVKTMLKTDNFLTFYKYFSYPTPSSELINDRVKKSLERVLFADDSYFNYMISGESVSMPDNLQEDGYHNRLIDWTFFNYNDLLVVDLEDTNKAFTQRVSVDTVRAIEVDSVKDVIKRIAYDAIYLTEEGEEIKGFTYIDDKEYAFYDDKYNLVGTPTPHDLGETPVYFIGKGYFSTNPALRKSMFTFVRGKLEEYNFLKTLQRLTEPNGAFPVVTKLDTDEETRDGNSVDELSQEPMSSNKVGGQRAQTGSQVPGATNKSPIQAGSVIEVPVVRNPTDGSFNFDIVDNYIRFFNFPVDALEFINKRVKELASDIVVSLLGQYSDVSGPRNELDVAASFVSQEDSIGKFSFALSRIRNKGDNAFLKLEYGRNRASADCFYGSDFFLETERVLLENLEKAPNPLERKRIIKKLNKKENRFNPSLRDRNMIKYDLLPFIADVDFDKAIERGIDDVTFQLQARFEYWIGNFEAQYGDIVSFVEEAGQENYAASLKEINGLLTLMIEDYLKQSEVEEEETDNQ